MESVGIIRVSRVHTWQKPCHSRLLSLSPHIQSINKSYVSSAFRTYLEFNRPSSPSRTQGAVISCRVMAVVSQLDFLLLPSSPATCAPHDHQLAKGRACQASPRTFQWLAMSLGWGGATTLAKSPRRPHGLASPDLFHLISCHPPRSCPLRLSPLWVPYHIVSISTNTLYVLSICLMIIFLPSCM